MTDMVRRVGWLVALVLLARTAHSQQLSGIATTTDGAVLVNALIRAQTPNGLVVAQARTDDHGRYTLLMPRGGSVLVDVLQLGFQRERVGLVTVAPTGTTALDVRIPRHRSVLSTVRVSTKRICRTPEAGDSAFVRFWEQVQAVMAQSAEVFSNPAVTSDVMMFESERLPGDPLVRHLALSRQSRTARPPFDAWPADSLARYGYVTEDASGSTFHAPDLTTMASDAFVREHCFVVRASGTANASRWVVEMTPAARVGEHRADVSGTFYASGDPLRPDSMTFHYEGLPDWIPETAANGRLRFARADDGAWIVDEWRLTLPITGRAATRSADGLSKTAFSRQPITLVGLKETGGQTLTLKRDGRSLFNATVPTIAFAVSAAPDLMPMLRLATFTVGGTNIRGTLNADSRVELGALIPGTYELHIDLPMRSPEAPMWRQVFRVAGREPVTLPFGVSSEMLLDRLCGSHTVQERLGAIAGLVVDSTGAPVQTGVQGVWINAARLPSTRKGDRLSASRQTVDDTSNAAGQFLLCNVPRTTLMARGDSVAWAGSVQAELREDLPFRFVRLVVRPTRRPRP